MSGATLFNLSLLTSDMWAVAIRVLFYQQEVIFSKPRILVPNGNILPNMLTYFICNLQINRLYYLAFTVVAIGLIIYSLK
jgi:solute carrier family 35, member F1/2